MLLEPVSRKFKLLAVSPCVRRRRSLFDKAVQATPLSRDAESSAHSLRVDCAHAVMAARLHSVRFASRALAHRRFRRKLGYLGESTRTEEVIVMG